MLKNLLRFFCTLKSLKTFHMHPQPDIRTRLSMRTNSLPTVRIYSVYNQKYISDCIPKNMPADFNTWIHVTGDFFLRERGEDDFLIAEASRAYLAWNVICFFFFYLAQPPPSYPIGVKSCPGCTGLNFSSRGISGGVDQLAFYNCCLKEVYRRTSLSPMKMQV